MLKFIKKILGKDEKEKEEAILEINVVDGVNVDTILNPNDKS